MMKTPVSVSHGSGVPGAAAGARGRWLVTGSAGFIGSHLLQSLLELGHEVTSLDNFATGHRRNLDEVEAAVGKAAWRRHRFLTADICDLAACRDATEGVDYILHQAALGSVSRSIEDPLPTHASNVTGFLNLLIAARDSGVKRFVYAASSSTYGDHAALPKVEAQIGRPLSPYAVTKHVGELYAEVFGRCYGMETIGLRYFNVFGARQDPSGVYAAVIPRWIALLMRGSPVSINGDGETTRDFCYIKNVVQANLRAATTTNLQAVNQVFNIAVGTRTSLNELHALLTPLVAELHPAHAGLPPLYGPFRQGDVRHSQADISKARELLGYHPAYDIAAGLAEAMPWYAANASRISAVTESTSASPQAVHALHLHPAAAGPPATGQAPQHPLHPAVNLHLR